MSTDPERVRTRSQIRSIAAQMAELNRRLAAVERASQLEHSSVVDADGQDLDVAASIRDGVDAKGLATTAQATADGKNTVHYNASGQPPASPAAGDLWLQADNGYQPFQWDGGQWQAMAFGTAAFAANSIVAGLIDAGAITADKLAAVLVLASRIIAGQQDGARVEIDETGIAAYDGEDPGDGSNRTVQILSDGTMNATGSFTGPAASFEEVTANTALVYQGEELTNFVAKTGAQLSASGDLHESSGWWSTFWRPLAYLDWDAIEGHMYQLIARPTPFAEMQGCIAVMRIQWGVPGGDYAIVDEIRYNVPEHNANPMLLIGYMRAPATRYYRLAFMGSTANATRRVKLTNYAGAPAALQMAVVDLGPSLGANIVPPTAYDNYTVDYGSGPTPSPPPDPAASKSWQTFNVAASETRSYRVDGTVRNVDEQPFYQGYAGPADGNQQSYIWFGAGWEDLDGVAASDLDYLDLYVYSDYWAQYSGGTLVIGWHSQAAAGALQSGTGHPDRLRAELGYGYGKWISLKGTPVETALRNGTFKGIQIGPAPSNDPDFYGRFRGDNQNHEPRLRARYKK